MHKTTRRVKTGFTRTYCAHAALSPPELEHGDDGPQTVREMRNDAEHAGHDQQDVTVTTGHCQITSRQRDTTLHVVSSRRSSPAIGVHELATDRRCWRGRRPARRWIYGRPRPRPTRGRWTPTAAPVHRPRHTLAATRCRRPASPRTGDRGDSGQVSEAEVMAPEPSTGVPTTVVDLCDGASASRNNLDFVSAAPTSQLFYSSGPIPGITRVTPGRAHR